MAWMPRTSDDDDDDGSRQQVREIESMAQKATLLQFRTEQYYFALFIHHQQPKANELQIGI